MRQLLGSKFVLSMASHCEGTSSFPGQSMWEFSVKVAMEQVYSQVLRVFPVNIIPSFHPLIH